jgi:hypothetical protein
VELSPVIRGRAGAQKRREVFGTVRGGGEVMKIAASEAVVPMLSVHKFG